MSSVAASIVTKTITAAAAASSSAAADRATPQGGVIEGGNPSHYDSKNPIILFIIQVCKDQRLSLALVQSSIRRSGTGSQ